MSVPIFFIHVLQLFVDISTSTFTRSRGNKIFAFLRTKALLMPACRFGLRVVYSRPRLSTTVLHVFIELISRINFCGSQGL